MTTPLSPAASPAPQPSQPASGAAVAALVLGIVAFLTGLVPVLGLVLGAAAVVLGSLALRRANGRGLSITGLVLGGVAALTSLVTTLLLVAGLIGSGSSTTRTTDLGGAMTVAPRPTATAAAVPTTPATTAPAVTPQPTASSPAPVKTAKPVVKPKAGAAYGGYPKSEARFVKIVERAAKDYEGTSHELKGARVLRDRDADACRAAGGAKVKSWVGTIHDVGATGDGDGYVEVEIAPTIVVQTWNNSLSDAFDDTLISPSASFYDRLSDLDEGAKVVFSGRFISSDDSCLDTANLTKTFNAADPNFVFKFSNVRAG